jgi:hypothetical protein
VTHIIQAAGRGRCVLCALSMLLLTSIFAGRTQKIEQARRVRHAQIIIIYYAQRYIDLKTEKISGAEHGQKDLHGRRFTHKLLFINKTT